jgi:hypothetical protein
MTNTITLTKLDDEADRIISSFEEATGLTGDDDGQTCTFEIEGPEHSIDIVQTLTRIDERWTDHVGVEIPG